MFPLPQGERMGGEGAKFLYGISKFPLIYVSSPQGERMGGEGAKFLYGISKFPLIYVSSPQGERMMEVRGLSSFAKQ